MSFLLIQMPLRSGRKDIRRSLMRRLAALRLRE